MYECITNAFNTIIRQASHLFIPNMSHNIDRTEDGLPRSDKANLITR